MRIPTLLLCACCLLPALPVQAQEPRNPAPGPVIEGMVSNEALQLRYMRPAPVSGVNSDLDAGLLIGDPHNVIASGAWMFQTYLENLVPHLHFAIGPQVYVASLAGQDRGILATSLGGDALYDLIPRYGVSAFGSAFYAPSIFIFGAADNVYDFTAGAQVRFGPHLLAMAGYRWFRFILQHSPNDTIVDGPFVGMRWEMQ